jgi:nicotinamidase/pyrazinamidase
MPAYQPGTALIVVDVQNDFADPRGSLAVTGADAIIPVVNREVARARAGRALVVCSQDWHPVHTPHFKKDGGIWPSHCVADSWGAELHPALEIPGGTAIVRKGSNGEDGYSAFTMLDKETNRTVPTMLEPLLQAAGIRTVVIVGLATDYCVRHTALDAVRLGFETVVLTDGIAAVNLAPDDGATALAELRAAGVSLQPSDPA